MDSRHILELKKKQIEANLTALFDEVREAIDAAVRCLVKKDEDICDRLIKHDAVLNERRRVLEQDCLVAIASQQPVAHDLRDIVADMRIASELARMGDYASDIARGVMAMDEADLGALGLLDVQIMAGLTQQMITNSMRAHQAGDAELARRLSEADDHVDARLHNLVDSLMNAMRADPANVHNGLRMLWIAHNLERCADRAIKIAEQVVFRMEGESVDLQ